MKRICVRRTLQLQFASAPAASLSIAFLIFSAIICAAQTPPGADGWVVLPVDDYRALREAAFPAEREP